jgi:hypothetical protein
MNNSLSCIVCQMGSESDIINWSSVEVLGNRDRQRFE